MGGGGEGLSLGFPSAKFPYVPVLTTSGTFDAPLKSAPSVNINSLVLIPLEALEWNKHISNWLCHEAMSCQDWALALESGRGGWWGRGVVPASHGADLQASGLVGSKPTRAVLSRGTQSHC